MAASTSNDSRTDGAIEFIADGFEMRTSSGQSIAECQVRHPCLLTKLLAEA